MKQTNLRVQYDDIRIDVTAVGHGARRIVLLPSLGRDVDDFFPIAQSLAWRDCRVLMPRPRGIGRSRGRMTDISLQDLASGGSKAMPAAC